MSRFSRHGTIFKLRHAFKGNFELKRVRVAGRIIEDLDIENTNNAHGEMGTEGDTIARLPARSEDRGTLVLLKNIKQ